MVRAYSSASIEAIEKSKIIEMIEGVNCIIECNYNQYSKLQSIFSNFECKVDDTEFDENVKVMFHLSIDKFSRFSSQIVDYFCGDIKIIEKDRLFFEK